MTADTELLRQYAIDGNEAAFAEVVRRQVNLVYGVALRVAGGNAVLAEDVTQSVFTKLATRAGPLSHHEAFAGWLHTTARFTALKAIRSEQRRQIHEREASTMNNASSTTVFDWEQLRPELDEAVGHLRERERAVVVLRFFQGLSHKEVGAALGLNENAARKCAERALEKLRKYFGRKGITLSSALLTTVITGQAALAAPAGLAEKITPSSLAGATGISVISAALLRILYMSTKTKIALAAATLAVIAFFAINFSNKPEEPKPASPTVAKLTPAPTIKATKTLTTPTTTVAIAETPPAIAPAQPAATTTPDIPATTAAAATPPASDAQSDLNSALTDIVARLRSGDIETVLKVYLPPTATEQQMAQVREAFVAFRERPESQKEMTEDWPDILGKLAEVIPPDVFNHVSNLPRARLSFQLPRVSSGYSPDPDPTHLGHIYLLKDKGLWYIEQFNEGAFSIDLRPAQVQAENPNPH